MELTGWKLGIVWALWSESLPENEANLETVEWEMERDKFLVQRLAI